MDMEVKIGSEVKIDCPELILGANCSIGIPEEENLSPAPKSLKSAAPDWNLARAV